MDENNLSTPLLQTASQRDNYDGNPQSFQSPPPKSIDNSLQKSHSKPLRMSKHRKRSEALKRFIRRKSLDETIDANESFKDYHDRYTIESTDDYTIHSETTERITNVESSTNNQQLQMIDEEYLPVSTLTKVKTVLVIAITIVACGAYCFAFSDIALGNAAAAAAGVGSEGYTNLIALGIAAGVCLVVTPVVWLNEWKLMRYPAMRRRVNALRKEANNLQREVNFLNMEIHELQTEIEGMEERNAKLQDITHVQDKNMESLVKLVIENQDILDEMREYLRQAVLQDIIKNILRSDEDRDGMLNKVEAKALEARLKLSLDAFGVVFDTEKFYRAIGLSPSLVNVISIVKRLLPDENNRVSSFYSIHSEDDYDSEDDSEDDEFDMFYIPVERETNCLCPDTLRLCQVYHEKMGRRPTLLSLAQHETLRNSMRRLRCEVGLIGCDCDD